MSNEDKPARQSSRREFISLAASAPAAALLAATTPQLVSNAAAQALPAPAVVKATSDKRKPNILFVFTDQERYTSKWPGGLSLPAHERFQKTGVTFHNHYCPATMCTSSRAVLMTGLQTPDNRMYENVDMPWVKNFSPDIPTSGDLLRKAGYYTAYKGKWHLNSTFDSEVPDKLFTKQMEQFGFADYFSPGDIIGHQLGGYEFDPLTAASAVTWLRRKGRPLADDNKPWCLYVSLVNPHDVMYFDTDLPGQNVQDSGRLFMYPTPAPHNDFYNATWDMPVPANFKQPFDTPGRPQAHGEFQKAWDYVLGYIPPEEERWQRFNNFYINSIRSVDLEVAGLLSELDALSLTDNTIVIYTTDHGEMAAAHGLRGKGPFVYEETNHLPFYLVHPDVKGGQDCKALTGHIDFVPTMLSMAGVDAGQASEFAGRELPGKDISPVLTNPNQADVNAVREAALFTYSGLATNDSDLWRMVDEAKAAGKNPAVEIAKQGFVPNMKKRGSLRSVYDGRYKFTRYFSPLERNRPTTLDELYKWNDVELFDLQTDPEEMHNLAADRTANGELIQTMSGKLEAQIKVEIGVDDGREMPNIPFIDWSIDRVDM